MSEEQHEESADFARAVKRLIDECGGHYTVCVFRQIEGVMFALMMNGDHAKLETSQ